MKKNILFAFVLAAAFTSCSNNNDLAGAGQSHEIDFAATLPSSSRTTFAPDDNTMKVTWAANDQIKVLNATNSVSQTFDNSENSTLISARFKGNLNVAVGNQLFAYYPASLTLSGATATVDY